MPGGAPPLCADTESLQAHKWNSTLLGGARQLHALVRRRERRVALGLRRSDCLRANCKQEQRLIFAGRGALIIVAVRLEVERKQVKRTVIGRAILDERG